jgi:AAA domain
MALSRPRSAEWGTRGNTTGDRLESHKGVCERRAEGARSRRANGSRIRRPWLSTVRADSRGASADCPDSAGKPFRCAAAGSGERGEVERFVYADRPNRDVRSSGASSCRGVASSTRLRMPEYQPTPEQEAVLAHSPEQHARLLAGPGTGKSATVVALLTKLLGAAPTPHVQLLTFTRAATAELAHKVAAHPEAAVDRPSTIHSFAISVLLRNPGGADSRLRCGSPTTGRCATSSSRSSRRWSA